MERNIEKGEKEREGEIKREGERVGERRERERGMR